MKLKSLIWALGIVLVLSLIGVAASSAQTGQATLIIINFVSGEMTFTLDGTPYAVPGVDTAPGGGQLTLDLAPGRHTYSAHIPGSEGANGEVELAAGQTQVLGVRIVRTGPAISPAGIVLEEPKDKLFFFEASLAPPASPTLPQPSPLQPLPAGQGALVFVNYIGEELIVDIGGEVYTVPANDRLQVDLPPGEVGYTASTSRAGFNGTAQVTAGLYTGLGFNREIPPEEPDYEVGEPEPTPVPLKMFVFPVPLDGEPVAEAAAPPPAVASPTADGPPLSIPAGQGTVTVVNYIGETLTFTINNQAYSVTGGGGELTINLAPGEYTFTASTPHAAANNSLSVSAAGTVQVSVASDVEGERIEIYVE